MKLISFTLSGKFGHFLKAEAGASAMSYPVPPRTVIIGIIGAILGLEKDTPQKRLEPAHIAVSGRLPRTFWHKAKLRKDPPAQLPRVIKKSQKIDKATSSEQATLIDQEWLFRPSYRIWASLPEPYHKELEERLTDRRWHFQPSLGLSEMSADIGFESSGEGEALSSGSYEIDTVFPRNSGEIDMDTVFERGIVLHSLRMPRAVTMDRVFTHETYFFERDARPVPVITEKAVEMNGSRLIFL